MVSEFTVEPILILTCAEPPSGNVVKRMEPWQERKLRKAVYLDLLLSLRGNHRWERYVFHPGLTKLARVRKLRILRHAGEGTGVRRYDDDRFREGCAVVVDCLQVDRVRRNGLGVIYSDSEVFLSRETEYVQGAGLTSPGILRVEIFDSIGRARQ